MRILFDIDVLIVVVVQAFEIFQVEVLEKGAPSSWRLGGLGLRLFLGRRCCCEEELAFVLVTPGHGSTGARSGTSSSGGLMISHSAIVVGNVFGRNVWKLQTAPLDGLFFRGEMIFF